MKYLILALLFTLNLYSYEVTVSILPQKYFVQQITKDKVKINVMVKQGFSPATYAPKTSQMRKLSKSKIYFSIDVPFEKSWLEKFKYSNKNMLLVDTTNGIKKIQMQKHEHHEDNAQEHINEKEEHDEHKHSSLDPHTWTDPSLVKIQAKNILYALIKVDKNNKDFYTKNYDAFIKRLTLLDNKIKKILKDNKNSAFMTFHPSWNYFAKAYNLKQITVEKEGKNPKIKEIIELIKDAKEHNIKVVFVSPQFSQNSAKKIAKSINGKVINLDSLEYQWEKNLIKVASTIKNSYK